METRVNKVLALFVLFIITLLFGYIPGCLKFTKVWRRLETKGIVNFLRSFTGGVFLATCLLHLLAGGREDFEEALNISGVQPNYPIFDLIVAVGFFIIVLVVRIVSYCLPAVPAVPADGGERAGLINDTPDESNNEQGGVADQPFNMAKLGQEKSVFKAVLLLIGLSFSNVFDGLAVGLQDSTSDVWQIMLAVCIKAVFISFTLGVQLFDVDVSQHCKAYLLGFVFSLMSPVGVAVGIGVTSGHIQQAPKLMTSAVLQALASGILLYVTLFEILLKTLTDRTQSLWNILVAAVGFGVIAGWKVVDKNK